MLVTAVMCIPGIWVSEWMDFVVHSNPFVTAYTIIGGVMHPPATYDNAVLELMLVVQGLLFMTIIIGLDMWLQKYFKGLDGNLQTVNRPQMDEY